MGSSGSPNLPPPGQPSDSPADLESARIETVPNITTFKFAGVEPPSPVYVQRDDVLVIEGQTQQGFDLLTVTVRLLLAPFDQGGQPSDSSAAGRVGRTITQGQIQTVQRTLNVPGPTPNTAQLAIPLSEGYLLSCVIAGSQATVRGNTFARAFINRGPLQTLTPNAAVMLFADYAVLNAPIGWPDSRTLYPTEGPGNMQQLQVANPGAGVDWSFTVPAGVRMRVQSFNAQFVTSAAVFTRIARVQVLGNLGNMVWQAAPSATQGASLTTQMSASSQSVYGATDPNSINLSLPAPLILMPLGTVRVNTTALQAGDVWSNIFFMVESWIDAGGI